VRVPQRDLRAPDLVAPEAARLEYPARAELVLGVLEDAAEGALVRRLGCLAQRLQLGHLRLDLLLRPRLQPELGARDDLPVAERRAPVGETKLLRSEPVRAVPVDHKRPLEDCGPVAPVGACVHPDSAADGAGDRAGELEAAE